MSSFTKQVRDWLSGFSRRAELDRLSKFDLNRIAGDARVSIGELYEVARRGPQAAEPLARRIRIIGINEAKLAHDEPATLQDMRRLCTLCDNRRRCERELNRHPSDANWRTYCPNAPTLRTLY
jgi:hypothetical protein